MKTKKRRDVLSAFKEANRSIELERNGGRWIAKDRPHKNKKKYCRKERVVTYHRWQLFLFYITLFVNFAVSKIKKLCFVNL